MLLWIGFGVLTAGVVAALIAPLRRAAGPPAAGASHDSAIYRDQLQEIETERRRGLFTADEASAARAEVARRLIKSAEASEPLAASPPAGGTGRPHDRLLYAIAVAIPLLSVAVYLAIGSPQIPGQPLAERQDAPGEASVAELIARVEARLRAEPEDGKGWDVIAPVYLRLGRYGDAVHAYSQANRILGEDVRRLVGFGEASLLKSNGVVGEDVRRAAERILAPRARPPRGRDLARPRQGAGRRSRRGGASAIARFSRARPPMRPGATRSRIRLRRSRRRWPAGRCRRQLRRRRPRPGVRPPRRWRAWRR